MLLETSFRLLFNITNNWMYKILRSNSLPIDKFVKQDNEIIFFQVRCVLSFQLMVCDLYEDIRSNTYRHFYVSVNLLVEHWTKTKS